MRICISSGKIVNTNQINIDNIKWRGLTCQIVLNSMVEGLIADIRKQPDNPISSIGLNNIGKPFKQDGTATLIVPDEDLEGKRAYIVIIDNTGTVLTQRGTVIGSDQQELL
jgi:hypothetical protein